jgi:hypothetical protein
LQVSGFIAIRFLVVAGFSNFLYFRYPLAGINMPHQPVGQLTGLSCAQYFPNILLARSLCFHAVLSAPFDARKIEFSSAHWAVS